MNPLDFKPPFIKVEIDGSSALINTNHIAWAHFKSTATTTLHMTNGEVIEVKHHSNMMQWIRQQYNQQ
jgi:hypothetical protein